MHFKLHWVVLFLALIGYTAPGCRNSHEKKQEYGNRFLNQALNDPSDYYYFDFSTHLTPDPGLPVGMFDSGTGGLTVLSAAVNLDKFDNSTGKYVEKGDGIKDFSNEEFIYFGDQANMPYGNYAGVNRTGFLKELALRDALFLLGKNYYRSGNDKKVRSDKQSVKLIVIACNTATAYAKDDIQRMIDSAGSRLKVIGVIDAGVRGALATFNKDENGTIGVMATAGTVSSDGYLNTFRRLKDELGYTGTINFVQHPGIGIAESIDEEPDYILRDATKPRKEYRGPSLSKEDLMIRRELTGIYRFDTLKNSLLCDYRNGICETMQLNSPENYMRYHLVTLCEKLRETPGIKPMKTLILGCTHYPYLSDFISKTLDELYDVKINGKYIYRDVLADSITLVDPAINTAIEAYEYLSSEGLLNKKGDVKKSEFYISVPDMNNPAVKTDSLNCLTYDYKYNRNEGHFYDTKHVPVSRMNTNDEIRARFASHIPEVFELIKIFDSENEKTSFLKPEDRF